MNGDLLWLILGAVAFVVVVAIGVALGLRDDDE